jgi:hypothetical protein
MSWRSDLGRIVGVDRQAVHVDAHVTHKGQAVKMRAVDQASAAAASSPLAARAEPSQ